MAKRTCTFTDPRTGPCQNDEEYGGLCAKHVTRLRHHGDPGVCLSPGWPWNLMEHLERQPNGCLWFTGGVLNTGYGRVEVYGSPVDAHVAVYVLHHGPVPKGYEIDHICHNGSGCQGRGSDCLHRRCCEISHLEAVTHQVNTLRGNGPSALNARKTRCIYGHPFDEENTYITTDGRRECRECDRRASRERRARLRRERSS